MKDKIHTTIGVYPSGQTKVNGVKDEHLDEHIQYNKDFRFGRALIVNRKLVYKGIGVQKKIINEIIKEIVNENPKYIQSKCTMPYI
jgi:hypothetical protein